MNMIEDRGVAGIILGLLIGLCAFLIWKDVLQQRCDRVLVDGNRKRNFVCKVELRAIVVDLNNQHKRVNK